MHPLSPLNPLCHSHLLFPVCLQSGGDTEVSEATTTPAPSLAFVRVCVSVCTYMKAAYSLERKGCKLASQLLPQLDQITSTLHVSSLFRSLRLSFYLLACSWD